jgi:hypothetical protein
VTQAHALRLGPVRRRAGSSAWRAALSCSPGARGRSAAVSRRAASRPARVRRPGWSSCRSTSVRQYAGQFLRRGLELKAQCISESAFFGFDDRAGVVGDEPARHGVGVVGVAQIAGAVKSVQARCHPPRPGKARSRCRAAMLRLPGGRHQRREQAPGCVPARRRPGRAPSGGGGDLGGVPGQDVQAMKSACSRHPG